MTLVELAITITILGVVAITAVPRLSEARDRAAVGGAASALTSALATTRHAAQRTSRRTALTVDTASAFVAVRAGADTLERLPLRDLFHVSLRASRDSIAYAPTGLGYGAANATFVISRGSAAETVVVSRLGRVRR